MIRNIKVAFWLVIAAFTGFVIHLFMYTSLLFYLFSKKVYRRINYWSAQNVWGFWGWLIFDIQKVPIQFEGDDLGNKENAIIVSNHQSWSDILVMIEATRKSKMTANLKWMAKDDLKWLPLVGWGMHFIDCIFLKRDWAKDKKAIASTFQNIITNNIPFWLAIFPEGTRKTPSKLAKSQRFSKNKGLPVWKNVMTPRPKGLSASIQGLRPNLKTIYSLTIFYHDAIIPHPGEMFAGLCSGVTVRVEKTNMAQLDGLQTDQDVKKFMIADFARKEEWIAGKKQQHGHSDATIKS